MQALIVRIVDRIESEPVLATTLVGALLSLLIVFGVPITDDQKTAIVVAITALLAIFARQQVTPTASPSLATGTSLTVTTTGQADKQVTVS